ncbi:MAG: TrkA C-terminal domain-containing protein, partial [Anaerovoracaceae bacterium]
LPLLALRVFRLLIALFFLVLTWRKFIGAPYLLLIVLGIILIILAIRSTFLRSHAIKLEARFVANFNERILHKKKEEEEDVWMGDKVYIVEFRLDDAGQCRTVASLLNERVLDVLVIKILRKERHINIPGPHEMVCSGDLVTVVSSKGQLEAYLIALENAEYIETPKEPMVTLREYMYSQIDREIPPEEQIMCCAIPISKGSGLHRKTIRNSGFRAKYEGFIVGIERDNYPIIDPPLNMIMEDGDLVWAIGTQGMAQRLLKDDLLQE